MEGCIQCQWGLVTTNMIPQCRAIFLLLICFSCLFSTWAQNPTHTISYFQNHFQNPNLWQYRPSRLFFFDDTQSAIYHDFGSNVYVSSDEGKSWSLASNIPLGAARWVIMHPFNNLYAFVLTEGTTHYVSKDRGTTWRPFDVPIPPTHPQQLSFHKSKHEYILYQVNDCSRWPCREETYYTKDVFGNIARLPLPVTKHCHFAHGHAQFNHDAHPDLIYCVADHLLSSTDFFSEDRKIEDLGIGHTSMDVMAFTIVSNFAVVVIRDLASGDNQPTLYVTTDTRNWTKAQFPPTSAWYMPVELRTHSLAVFAPIHQTLFVSDSNGTFFVESLKNMNTNSMGVDYVNLYGLYGVGLANVVENGPSLPVWGAYDTRELRTMITFDDGSSWAPIVPPSTDIEGRQIYCNHRDIDNCSLHLHSLAPDEDLVVDPIYSSPAQGFVMGVGSIGATWDPQGGGATFLSTNAGVDWKMVDPEICKYAFGDQGSLLILINAEKVVSNLRYSTDMGNSWQSYDFGINIRAHALTATPDSLSQKFILLGEQYLPGSPGNEPVVVVFLDFTPTRKRQCGEDDFEKWYVRTPQGRECLMGHKQWYKRRKIDADCYVGIKFEDPVHEENCPCDEGDFECDFNFVRDRNECVPLGPERIPAGICTGIPNQMYQGSSGWRKIAGNTCVGGLVKDNKVDKMCSQAEPAEGQVTHQTFQFPSQIVQHTYIEYPTTNLVRLADYSMWQSSNEGYTWKQLFPEERFYAIYHNGYNTYLITNTKKFWYTTNAGHNWYASNAPTLPNTFQTAVLEFNRSPDNLIWTGDEGCTDIGENCHAEAHYSGDNGRTWTLIDTYVQKCTWPSSPRFYASYNDKVFVDEVAFRRGRILCQSYSNKLGSQKTFNSKNNVLQLVEVGNSNMTQLLDYVVGFTDLSRYWIVAQYLPQRKSVDLQVSSDGRNFKAARFPPNVHPETNAFTIIRSTPAIFLHMTMSEHPSPQWGDVLKSDSTGTLFGLSVKNVNRDEQGFVDFEKLASLDGVALVNIVSNTQEAQITKRKILQTRITHNDGGSWKSLVPPKYDSMGQKYECDWASCTLHLHGYTGRPDPTMEYSVPSAIGLVMAVGNVGEELAPYSECDTFLSRDAGFTWEEVHKGTHLWSFGDSGSILVMANDEKPTNHVLFSADEGLTWRKYKFGDEEIRVRKIVTIAPSMSRRLILIGNYPGSEASFVVRLDFSALTLRQCSSDGDFEMWNAGDSGWDPSHCLFGQMNFFGRRRRYAYCVTGDHNVMEWDMRWDMRPNRPCDCEQIDFECEFNHIRDENDECVLIPGALPLPDDNSCRDGSEFWHEKTAYRKIPFSNCEGGLRLHLGVRHACPGFKKRRALVWLTTLMTPVACLVIAAVFWYYRRSGVAQGAIRLPDEDEEK